MKNMVTVFLQLEKELFLFERKNNNQHTSEGSRCVTGQYVDSRGSFWELLHLLERCWQICHVPEGLGHYHH